VCAGTPFVAFFVPVKMLRIFPYRAQKTSFTAKKVQFALDLVGNIEYNKIKNGN